MIAANTSFVPRVIEFQNGGNMTIMHQAMLNFGRALFSTARSSLNYSSSYLKSGAEVFKQTKEHTYHESRELFETFKACLDDIPHSSTQSPRLVDGLEQGVYLLG